MKRLFFIFFLATNAAFAADKDGFVPLFNGHDLKGWVNANCAPETWSVRDGMIHCTGHPTGAMRTARQYENFIIEVDWRFLDVGGNSGVFIWGTPISAPAVPFLRGIEVQVLDNGFNVPGKNQWYTTHGDVFPIHGATMKPFGRHNGDRSFPSEERSKSSPEWNHYRVVCTNGVIRLHVNGKEVSGGEECNYRKGYLALESEGAQVEFKNVRIKELPSSGASPEMTAPLDLGWRNFFNSLDLRGWKTNAATTSRWKVGGERLSLKAGEANPDATLWTEKKYGNAEFILDCYVEKPAAGQEVSLPVIELRGAKGKGVDLKLDGATPGWYQRFTITVKGRDVTVKRKDLADQHITLPSDAPKRGQFGLRDTGGALQFMNFFVRDL